MPADLFAAARSVAGPAVVGHRGAPLVAPENTLPAFLAAAEAGAGWVELDARRSRDGVPVVHHDAARDGVPLVERSSAELRELGVLTLGEVLAGLPPALGVDVEVKNLPGEPDYDEDQAIAAAVAAVLADAPRRPLLVTSFNPMTALALREAIAVPVGLLSADSLRLDAAAEVAADLGMDVVCPHVDAPGLDAQGVATAHAAGLGVLVWTVNDGERARHLAQAGVDALCTDDPEALLAALAR